MSTWKPNARLLAAGVLTKKPIDYTRHLERIPTPWIEEDKALTLELVVYKPIGNGPFPTLVFNHGSTGSGTKPEWFTHTWTSPPLARHFTNRGWMVLFPQRRGRGKSDGLYDEGFVADRSRYACESTRTLAGFERALEDLDVAMQHVRAHRDVDRERVLVGGLSRGGILSIVYAASRKEWFGGVLNFVGGWVDEGCSVRENINPVVFRRGAPFGKPTLWLYGDDDPFYSLAHSAENFKAFKDAGGIGTFIEFQPPGNESGHNIYARPALWTDSMNAYLDSLGWR
ncbi:MAG: alpha/beta hydrolase [Gammaproteobacteria bacterium]|nr:alpha/beta hydrolase [Gammaproteobacteria bacterium]